MEWTPQDAGLLQLAALLGEFQKPGTDQSQVRIHPVQAAMSDFILGKLSQSSRSAPRLIFLAGWDDYLEHCSALTGSHNVSTSWMDACHRSSQLEQYKLVPDFNNYLAFIFAKGEQLAIEVGT